jgi:hypothetical protein
MSDSPHPIFQTRRAQMFPTLASADIGRLRRFGEAKTYRSGERIIRAGEVAPGLIVIVSGKVEVTQGRGLDRQEAIVTSRARPNPWRRRHHNIDQTPCRPGLGACGTKHHHQLLAFEAHRRDLFEACP